MKTKLSFLLCLFLVFPICLSACNTERSVEEVELEEEPEQNVLKDYINKPKESAREAGRQLEDAQNRAKAQLEQD